MCFNKSTLQCSDISIFILLQLNEHLFDEYESVCMTKNPFTPRHEDHL